MVFRVMFIILLIVGSGSAVAEPLIFSDEQSSYSAVTNFEALEDPNDDLDITDVISNEVNSRFVALNRIGKLKDHRAYWLRLKVLSQHKRSVTYAIELPEDELDSYLVQNAKPEQTGHSGLLVAYENRNPSHLLPLALITVKPEQESVLYIRVKHQWGHRIQANDPTYGTVYNYQMLQKLSSREGHLLGLYYGLILVICLISLVMYVTFRNPVYGVYSVFSILFGLYSYSLSGYAYQYLWPSLSRFNKISAIFLAPCLLLSFTYFTLGFLQLGKITPRLKKTLIALALSFFVTIPLFLTNNRTEAYIAQAVIGASVFFLILLGGTLAVVNGQSSAWMFLAGNISLIAVSSFQFLTMLSILPYTIFFRFGMQAGSAFQLVAVLLGLFYDLWQIRREQERAAQRELELQKCALESKQKLLDAFARFIPTDFLRCLGKHDITQVRLGDATERKMAVLFSDIRSFSTLSETLSPQDNFAFLNTYLSEVGPIITKYGGFIDKFIGDGIMALFPNGNDGALKAGQEMIERTQRFNFRTVDGRMISISIGIGIHYGAVILGTIGEHQRMEGTVISDAVNVASRIEQLTKMFRVSLVSSEDYLKQLAHTEGLPLRRLGNTRIRGRSAKLNVYEVFACDSDLVRQCKFNSRPEFERAITLFEGRQFEEANEIMQQLANKYPEDEVVQYFASKSDWTGLTRIIKAA
ncbi:MAG TPA: hypothetical protein DCS07_01755 [Bdellovibrionales bacterium]|nr:hypothetical protein [Bdellovibrionales bacterium]HCM39749.1 hypothetical protein [Bdellovibrionales bacterium]